MLAVLVLTTLLVASSPALRGRNTPTCLGRPATIVGSPHADVIRGTPGPDVIFAGAGNDVVYGRGGDDRICGGPGNDVLYGSSGNDVLSGGPGNDVLIGGPGRDTLLGGPGRDQCELDGPGRAMGCEHMGKASPPKGAGAPPAATGPPPPAASAPPGDVQPAFPIRAAFFYPWFPQAWKQQGLDPFTRYHPSLGFYDGASPAVIAAQIRSMQYAHIQAGILSWWGQGTLTDSRVAPMLSLTDSLGSPFRWSVYYEQEAQGDPSVAQIHADLVYIGTHYGGDRAFLRVGGRFVVFVYADPADGCSMVDRWRQAEAGTGAYVVLKVFPGYTSCPTQPDDWHQYSPAVPEAVVPGRSISISPGFYKANAAEVLARDPVRFAQDARDLAAASVHWQLVTTFNEWGEGTAVESAQEWASASGQGTYLDALHDAP